MSAALDEIRWSAPLLEATPIPKQLALEAKSIAGRVPPYVALTAPSPWMTRLLLILEAHRVRSHLTSRDVDVVGLVTAQENACRFCYGMQRAAMRIAGYSEDEILRIERNVDLGDGQTRALVDFCRRLAQSNPRPARSEREGLERLGFTPEHIRELAFEIAAGCMFHRVTTLLAAPPLSRLEHMAAKWWSIFLRPAFVILRRPRRGAAFSDSGEGPWGPIVAALNGTAAPPVLRRMIEALFAPSALPLRTKLLMLSIIARALGCPFCEANTIETLSREGLTREETLEVLDTMQSPTLTALETKLLPFARATVRYEPFRIQERTAALLADIGAEQTLEVVGVASMGNMLVRLAMLLAP